MSKVEYIKCDMCGAMTDDTYKDEWSKVVRNNYFDDVLIFYVCPKCIDKLGEFVEYYSTNRSVTDANV